jgi:hypothetical protein
LLALQSVVANQCSKMEAEFEIPFGVARWTHRLFSLPKR